MKWYKYIVDGYIVSIGTGGMGTEIAEAEYNEIMTVILSRPADTPTVGYRLREDLAWEAFEIEPPELEENNEAEQAVTFTH